RRTLDRVDVHQRQSCTEIADQARIRPSQQRTGRSPVAVNPVPLARAGLATLYAPATGAGGSTGGPEWKRKSSSGDVTSSASRAASHASRGRHSSGDIARAKSTYSSK